MNKGDAQAYVRKTPYQLPPLFIPTKGKEQALIEDMKQQSEILLPTVLPILIIFTLQTTKNPCFPRFNDGGNDWD